MKHEIITDKGAKHNMMAKLSSLEKLSKSGKSQISSTIAKSISDFLGRNAPQEIGAAMTGARTGLDVEGQAELVKRIYKSLNKGAPAGEAGVSAITKSLPKIDVAATSEGALGGAAVGGAAGAVIDDGSYDTESPMGTMHHEGGITGRLRGALKGALGGAALGGIARASDSAKILGSSGDKVPKIESMLAELAAKHPHDVLRSTLTKEYGALDPKLFGRRGISDATESVRKHIESLGLGDSHADPGILSQGTQSISDVLGRFKDRIADTLHLPIARSNATVLDDTATALSPLLGEGVTNRSRTRLINDLIDLRKNNELSTLIKDNDMAESLQSAIEKIHMRNGLKTIDAPFKQNLPILGGAAGAILPLALGLPGAGLLAGAGGVGSYLGLRQWLDRAANQANTVAGSALATKPWAMSPATALSLGNPRKLNADPSAVEFKGNWNNPAFISRLAQLGLI